jgi:hypothetical protein
VTIVTGRSKDYAMFGRLIPVKANLAFELYQSQCLQKDPVLKRSTLGRHPMAAKSEARREYQQRGEMAFLDERRQRFSEAVAADPFDFLDRAAGRFLAATLLYEPYEPGGWQEPAWLLWFNRLTHPLAFLALLVLLSARSEHCSPWPLMTVYIFYLIPYIGISYYERYAFPLVVTKIVLILWAADRLLSLLADRRAMQAQPAPHSPAAAK